MNLGYSGNGPLLELAGLREYASRLRPAHVFWMYDEANDILSYSPPADLDVELGHPILAKYLAVPGFTQHLYDRQNLVNARLNQAADAWVATPPRLTVKQHLVLSTTREVLRGAYIALRVSLPVVVARDAPLPEARIGQFADIMRLADADVASWGGRFVFVNLPALLPACLGRDHPSRAAILDIPRRLGIDVVDLEGPLFDLARAEGARAIAAEPSCGGHYSEAAYALIAEKLLEYLQIAQGAALPPFWSARQKPDGTRQLIYAGHAHDRTKPLRP